MLLALCEGNPSFPGGFPSQRPVTRSFDISFDLCLTKRQSLICKVSFDNLMIILVQKGNHFHYFYEIKPGWLWRMTSRDPFTPCERKWFLWRHDANHQKWNTRHCEYQICHLTVNRVYFTLECRINSSMLDRYLSHGVQQRSNTHEIDNFLCWAIGFSHQSGQCKRWHSWPVPHIEDTQHGTGIFGFISNQTM